MLQVKHLDFEALTKDLPKSNPFVFEVSHVFDVHMESIKPESKKQVKEIK